LVIGTIADTLGRGVEGIASGISETFFEPVIRLGVTGLARSGKTVFITSLVANLLDRGRMPGLEAARSGRIEAAFLQPQPDDTVPRFAFEDHLAAMTGTDPHWPDSTRAVSELRLSLRVRPAGLLGAVSGPRTVHLDIVDYPGEWLLDLALLDLDFDAWSRRRWPAPRPAATVSPPPFSPRSSGADPRPSGGTRGRRAGAWLDRVPDAARAAGFSDCTPGRFLLPGDLEGSPALTFAPLPPARSAARIAGARIRPPLRGLQARSRQTLLPRPFRADRPADRAGGRARGDPCRPAGAGGSPPGHGAILGAFRPGRNAFLSSLLGRRVDRILFAATKADHLHHTQHPRLEGLIGALVADARRRAEFSGAETRAMAIASLRATTEETRRVNGPTSGSCAGGCSTTGGTPRCIPVTCPRIPPPSCPRRATGRRPGSTAITASCASPRRPCPPQRRGPAPYPPRPRGGIPDRGPAVTGRPPPARKGYR
jgi:predicted YcjX-like family ATPase